MILCFASILSYATHNRAGEITYTHVSAYRYSITLTTYTYSPSAANEDRNTLTISWGDNTMSDLPRINILMLPDDYQKNSYTGTHNFPGPGTYNIVMEDKNRNEGIDNITESVYVPFTVKTQLTINALLGDNSAPLLLNPPIDKAVVGQIFIHNPTAYDLDGDSLSYYLTTCAGSGGLPIEGYRYPAASNRLYIDAVSGDLVWDAPMAKGRYNVAMVIAEHRKGIQISAIVRDIQIDVEESDNLPPQITAMPPLCVFAGDTVRFAVQATDPDGGTVNISAVGGPLSAQQSPAHFATQTGVGTVTSDFIWATNCAHIRQQPYSVLFKAVDSGPPSLTDQKTTDITVMGKAQEIDTVSIMIDELRLSLSPPTCNNAERLLIFRSQTPAGISGAACPPDMPAEYTLIADTVSGIASYTDDNRGKGLPQGFGYCYRTQSVYPGEVLSYPGREYCTEAGAGAPVFANVSIQSQDSVSAQVFVRWASPVNPDTSIYPHPYRAELYASDCGTGLATALLSKHAANDTSTLMTVAFGNDTRLCYQVQWYSSGKGGDIPIGRPIRASSIQASAKVSDRKINLFAEADVPWKNLSYVIFRSTDEGKSWDSIGISASPNYTDSSVTNHLKYCYRIESQGGYSLRAYPQALSNWSNIICATPIDTVAPQSPKIQLVQDCNAKRNILSRSSTAEDGSVRYFVYYKECESHDFRIIATLDSTEREYSHSFADSTRTMGGCYAMSSQDASGNRSALSEPICTYSCPTYSLPNVFTPNGDGVNDRWEPIQNKYVQRIELELFDIWGNLVFTATDPQIRWDGANSRGQKLTDGMYYYICDVYEQWLSCQSEPRTIIGFVHKFSDGKPLPTTK